MELKEVTYEVLATGDKMPSGYYMKTDVDAVLSEKDKEIARLNTEIKEAVNTMKVRDKENANLKGRLASAEEDRDYFKNIRNKRHEEEIAELKAKLENVQSSMYADVVDANMEVRRLKRALYIVLARSFCCMRELAARNALYDDECKWDNFKTTCLKKAEECK